MNAEKYIGKKITKATFGDDAVGLTFEDGTRIRIWDAGQSCCENRYMSTDDNVSDLIGHALVSIETKDAPGTDSDYDAVTEVSFLEIRAGHETVTFANYNEHNGYYGGFYMNIKEGRT